MSDLSENERRRLADYLRQYMHDTLSEWMRIVDIEQHTLSPSSDQFQARALWQGDGSMVLSESPYGGENYGHYRVTVHVEPLPPVPPIGPENDPAMIEEMKADHAFVDASSYGAPGRCAYAATLSDASTFCFRTENEHEEQEELAEWELSTWGMVLVGDAVRLPGNAASEMHIVSITPEQLWHVKDGGTGKWWDDAQIEHVTRTARMKDRAASVSLPPETPIEIYMDAERHGILLLQFVFLESERIES